MLIGGNNSSSASGSYTVGLTNEELRATPVPVSVSGTAAVTGPATDAELRAVPLPVSGTVAVSNLPATQPVSGTVTAAVSNFPATQAVSGTVTATGPLTDTQLRASAVPVSLASAPTTPVTGTFWQSTQPVSLAVAPTTPVTGTFWQSTQPVSLATAPTTPVTGTFWQNTQPVSGPLTDTQLRAVAVPVSLATAPTTPVTGTFWQSTQPVSIAASVAVTGPATDTQLRATPLPVSGTVTATGPLTDTQLRATAVPVSGPLTDTQLRATAVPVSGPLTDTQIRATALPVSGTVAATQSGTWTVQPGNTANTTAWKVDGSAVTQPVSVASVVSVTLGSSTGKTLAMKTGSIVTTAVTADQVILTYTVTSGKTFYLQYFGVQCRLTTFAATATLFGTASLESPSGTKLITKQIAGTGMYDSPTQEFAEPLPIAAGTVIRVVCTPATTTSFTWQCVFGGFEK